MAVAHEHVHGDRAPRSGHASSHPASIHPARIDHESMHPENIDHANPMTTTPIASGNADAALDAAASQRAEHRLAWARAASADATFALQRASTDAGFRSYWRGGIGAGSRIVMDSPPALEDVRPWLHIHGQLDRGGVRVPRIFARDETNGFLLLEDLGADTCLQVVDDGNADDVFEAAISQLLRLQALPCAPELPGYDADLLHRELRLFDEWFLGRHLGVTLDAAERAQWLQVGDVLVAAAQAQAQVFVHRDFMLRNLMPVDGGVAVLDFQDAVRGPIAYDVLSLFKDAFLSWPRERVVGWVDGYHARAVAAGLPVPDRGDFQRDVDHIGIHRHLKVLGIFARLQHRDGKPKYLADAPRFIRYLDEVLPAYPALAPLQAILRRHVPTSVAR